MSVSRILAASIIPLAFAACSSSAKPDTTPAPAAAPGAPAAPAAQTGGSPAGDTVVATEVLVNVQNDRTPPSNYTIYVVGPSVGRMILGDLPMNQSKAFTFKAGNLNGYYKLIAQAPGGAELPSQAFNLTPTLRFVQWTLSMNTIVQYATPK